MAQSLAKDRDIAQLPYIEWFRAYLIFNGQYMVLANDLEGGFKNINAMNKTSKAWIQRPTLKLKPMKLKLLLGMAIRIVEFSEGGGATKLERFFYTSPLTQFSKFNNLL